MALTATLQQTRWRFAVGDDVFIAGHPQYTAKVTAAFGHGRSAWPHYMVLDYEGTEWTVPQQLLSRTPILP
jgi:hypothetical protein